MIELRRLYEKLDNAEAKRLAALLREKQGNVKACAEVTDLNVNTLKRAAAGLEVLKVNAKIIREKLLSNELQAA